MCPLLPNSSKLQRLDQAPEAGTALSHPQAIAAEIWRHGRAVREINVQRTGWPLLHRQRRTKPGIRLVRALIFSGRPTPVTPGDRVLRAGRRTPRSFSLLSEVDA